MSKKKRNHGQIIELTINFHSDLKTFLKSAICTSSSCRFCNNTVTCRPSTFELLIFSADISKEKFLIENKY